MKNRFAIRTFRVVGELNLNNRLRVRRVIRIVETLDKVKRSRASDGERISGFGWRTGG